MHFVEYKSYIIYPAPSLQIETGCWKAQMTIRKNNNAKLFDSGQVLTTKAEAVFYSIKYGKSLIDKGIQLD